MANTQLVGILNLTPDSFSDGGESFSPIDAVKTVCRHMEAGAEVLDIGAESTRPGATPIDSEEEWARLAPMLTVLPLGGDVQFSVDTRHPETAERALDLGVDWINDVSGFSNPDMLAVVRDADCQLVVMHSLSVPADKNIVLPESVDPVQEVLHFARSRLKRLQNAGIDRDRIIFDPGIGFGKTVKQSRALIDRISEFHVLGVPLLVGHSRKSFLGEGDRDAATLAVSRQLIAAGVDYLRVHDVASHRALLMKETAHG